MRVIVVILLTISMFSCSLQDKLNVPVFYSIREANTWIYNNIEYKPKNYYSESIFPSSPEILERRYGNCKDMTRLLNDICYEQFKVYGIEILTNNGAHEILYINNMYYDPTNNKTY